MSTMPDNLMDRRRQVKLGRWETRFCIGVWTGAVLYSIYSVFLFTNTYFENYNDTYNDFDNGWYFVNRKIDISDDEWRIWIPLIHQLFPWIIVHIYISQCIKCFFYNKTLLCSWYILISTTFLWHYFGVLSTLCTLLLPCISCLLVSIQSKTISWFVHCIILALIHWAKVSDLIFREWLVLKDKEYFMITTAICWIQLRSISYSIDSIETYKHVNIAGFFKDLLQNIAYCIYLPTLFLGPVILYQEFIDGINKPFTKWTKEKSFTILLNLIRYVFWMYFTQFSLHFLYFNALIFHPEAVMTLRPWAFYGLGYCMGQYFLNKYVVVYGLSTTICKTEDINAPPQPKCIGRIHLYSNMWKHFDRGLYKFLLRYIYVPCNPKTSFQKFFASAICFIFIYIWHGMQLYVFLWVLLNFLSLNIENLVKCKGKYFYKIILRDSINLQNKRRLECALSSPLLAVSAVSNFYFFAGDEIGNIYMWKFFEDSWETSFILLFILYCCCQTSTEIKQLEEIKLLKWKEGIRIKIK